MKRSRWSTKVRRPLTLAAASAGALLLALGAVAAGNPDFGTNDNEVTVGSLDSFFSPNKQNEPAVAINPINTDIVAAGANDNIDLERCNAGADNTCPFTDGVGVTGVQFSVDGGDTWVQPEYTGWTARNCVGTNDPNPVPANYQYTDTCVPEEGPIGTLPWYYESGLVADGDPVVAFGPRPGPNGFSWVNGARLYFATLASNFSSNRTEQSFKGFEAIAVSRTDDAVGAAGGNKNAWMPPVIVSKQNGALFSDKEAVWADNAESSRFFGNAYICNVAFRGNGGAEPVVFHRSTDGGDTWQQRQITQAANTGSGAGRSGGRQGCTIRTDSTGIVSVFFNGSFAKQDVQYLARSFDGGVSFEKARPIVNIVECGQFDPATGRFSFDGIAGARTNSFPSADIANGAPTGADATDEIVLTWCNGPTPNAAGESNETAPVAYSTDRGQTFRLLTQNSAEAVDRPDFPAIAISPDGADLYVTYMAFDAPWQSTTASPRMMGGVVRHADVAITGASKGILASPFMDIHRGTLGDARGSSQNGLTAEFLGDYNYAAATRSSGVAVWNDVRQTADCPAIDKYRMAYAEAVLAGNALPAGGDRNSVTASQQAPKKGGPPPPTAPEPNNDCLQTINSAFGNSDIWGGEYEDPTSP